MKIIPREAGRITYSTEIRNLKKLSFDHKQKELIIGSLLGDGHLCQNWSGTNFRLKVSQAKKQEDYVFWKYNILKDFVLTGPKLHASTNSIRFATISHPELTNFHNIFYQGRKKIVPKNIGKYLSPLALAVWFMDDGNVTSYNHKVVGYHINSQSFTRKENEFLVEVLKNKYGIVSSLQYNNGSVRIYVRAQSRVVFRELLKGHLLPSLKYKLG